MKKKLRKHEEKEGRQRKDESVSGALRIKVIK